MRVHLASSLHSCPVAEWPTGSYSSRCALLGERLAVEVSQSGEVTVCRVTYITSRPAFFPQGDWVRVDCSSVACYCVH